jgi:vacuolar-type H+-ATPase subunit I/STV1
MYRVPIHCVLTHHCAEFSGVDTIKQKLNKHCRVQFVPWLPEQTHTVYSEITSLSKKAPKPGQMPERLQGLRGYESILQNLVERGEKELESVEEQVARSHLAKELYSEAEEIEQEVLQSEVAKELIKEGKDVGQRVIKSKLAQKVIQKVLKSKVVKELTAEAKALSVESFVFVVCLLAIAGVGLFCALTQERRHKARHEKYSA